MVTRIRKRAVPHVYLAEWMEHKGLDVPQMAERLDMERESLYRWLREPRRINLEKLGHIAYALGVEPPHRLFQPPSEPSLDDMLAGQPDAMKELARDVVARLLKQAS